MKSIKFDCDSQEGCEALNDFLRLAFCHCLIDASYIKKNAKDSKHIEEIMIAREEMIQNFINATSWVKGRSQRIKDEIGQDDSAQCFIETANAFVDSLKVIQDFKISVDSANC